MKCTKVINGGLRCGKETNMNCPPKWIKHKRFDPLVLKIFFLGLPEEKYLDELKAFLCLEHRGQFIKDLAQSRRLQKKKEPEYEI